MSVLVLHVKTALLHILSLVWVGGRAGLHVCVRACNIYTYTVKNVRAQIYWIDIALKSSIGMLCVNIFYELISMHTLFIVTF